MGVLSHKFNKLHLYGKVVAFTYVLYCDIWVYHQRHSLQSSGWTAHQRVMRKYFHRLRAQVFRVWRRCYTISINVSTWFIIFLGYLYFVWRFGATFFRTSKNSWWCRCSRQHVRICNLICSKVLQSYLTVLKLHEERIGHLYDIEIFVQIILSLIALPRTNYLTSKFNSLIFLENYHWLFHLDRLFGIQDDPGFFQNSI